MKRYFNYIPVVLGVIIVSIAIYVTGGFAVSTPSVAEWEEAPTSLETKVTETTTVAPTTQTTTSLTSTTTTTTTTEATTAETTTATTTTTTKKPENLAASGGKFSSIRVFLDLQRIIFYRVDPQTNEEYEAYAVRCSTGTSQYRTPVSGPNKPFVLGGAKAKLTIFRSTKSTVDCWVRYATHLSGSIWFHSVPYDYIGKTFDPTRCYMWAGYDVLGKQTSSHGCIRMALRDANFLYSNSYRGMPCYVISSYSAVYPGQTAIAPAPLPPALQGPRNWDPTDPNYPGYSTPQPIVVLPPPTTAPPATEEFTEETSVETTATPTTFAPETTSAESATTPAVPVDTESTVAEDTNNTSPTTDNNDEPEG